MALLDDVFPVVEAEPARELAWAASLEDAAAIATALHAFRGSPKKFFVYGRVAGHQQPLGVAQDCDTPAQLAEMCRARLERLRGYQVSPGVKVNAEVAP